MTLFIKGIARTKVRSLMKLGVSERLSIACGITSTKVGAWKRRPLSKLKTKGINIALGNDYLASQGLVSLKDIWINIHYGSEPPIADPHDGWCGGWRLETSGYPIMHRHLLP